MNPSGDDDLRTLVREFRTSVAADLAATHQQMVEFADEVRNRITTSETAVLNAIRDLRRDMDWRHDRTDERLADVDARFDRVDEDLSVIKSDVARLNDRRDG
ncbi:hypothetical protein BH23ACT9_BH23ACT9_15080 [soil metagenome]